jgi:uracil-DNA glycosylase
MNPDFLTAHRDSAAIALREHHARLRACRRCPRMHPPPVPGNGDGPMANSSRVLLVGQAPGVREPVVGRPFAHTAGRTLFGWFQRALGWTEDESRARFHFAAVCRCFPGKAANGGGDRVPDGGEIANCAPWLTGEIALIEPALVLPVGRLAIAQFVPGAEKLKLDALVGRLLPGAGHRALPGVEFDLLPLPHPSGASTWHRMEPGRTLLDRALTALAAHPAVRALQRG